MSQITWVTPAGNLGTIPEGVYYSIPLEAVDPDSLVYYRVISGNLPAGMQLNETGVLVGSPIAGDVQGIPALVNRDVTSQFCIRAYTQLNRLADRTFTLTINGTSSPTFITPPGEILQCYDGSILSGFQIEYVNTNPDVDTFVTLISGSLPPGITLSRTGLLSGYIPATESKEYVFTVKISNGPFADGNVRTFSIKVWSHSIMVADTTVVTADNNFITADVTNIYTPVLLNPQGSIGTYNSDNWFAYKFNGIDPSGEDDVQYIISSYSPTPLSTLGLTLDISSGWLYGQIPSLGILPRNYSFDIQVYKKDNAEYISNPYSYELTITGPISGDITWLTPSDLGVIDNGATSTFYVEAVSKSNISLQYQLLSGSDSQLPQGLQLLPSGHIAGRVSFDTFALDSGATTFDVDLPTVKQPTTFDMVFTFTVNVTSVNGLVNDNKTFSIRVIRRYNEPYDNLYIQAMPPQNDRDLLASLLQNPTIFPPSLIYRNDDPNFGVATRVVYNHAYGLRARTLDDYVASLNLNHYWKNLVLGEIKTARALDDNGKVLYEVVYSEVVDELVNNQGESVSKQVVLPFPLNEDQVNEIDSVYPNSLQNMRDQVIDVVGQISNVLPRWMLSTQENGRTLGFTPAWVIAYTKPGQSGQIAYNIQTQFGTTLNTVDFEVDRYELDNLLTKNWDRAGQHWDPQPATLTTFDYDVEVGSSTWINNNNNVVTWVNNSFQPVTWENDWNGQPTTFDYNSMQFIAPVDMYSNTTDYDKYLVFPKRNILE